MAINKIQQSGHTQYGLCEFVIDTAAEIDDLPIDIPMGSTAFVIDTSAVYMLKSNGVWKEI